MHRLHEPFGSSRFMRHLPPRLGNVLQPCVRILAAFLELARGVINQAQEARVYRWRTCRGGAGRSRRERRAQMCIGCILNRSRNFLHARCGGLSNAFTSALRKLVLCLSSRRFLPARSKSRRPSGVAINCSRVRPRIASQDANTGLTARSPLRHRNSRSAPGYPLFFACRSSYRRQKHRNNPERYSWFNLHMLIRGAHRDRVARLPCKVRILNYRKV